MDFSTLEKIGLTTVVLIVCYCIAKLYSNLKIYYFGKQNLQSRLKKYGNWAVITGCTRGCGEEFCRQLAALGFNLVMVARNETLLNRFAKEIETKFGVKTCPVRMDLDEFPLNTDNLQASLAGKDIGILVNNAGMMIDHPMQSHMVDDKTLRQLLTVNVNAVQQLTFLLLKHSFIPKNRGLIVNLSSGGAHQPMPMIGPYAASKIYVDYISEAVRFELLFNGHNNIHVQVLDPMFISTDMTHYNSLINTPSVLSPDPERYVRSALATFGTTNKCTGFLPHTIQLGFSNLFAEFMRSWAAGQLMAYLAKEKKR